MGLALFSRQLRRDFATMIKRAFTEHPASVGESYFGHLGCALSFSGKMVGGGLVCLLHGFFPFLFVKTGSKCIEELHYSMVTHRDTRSRVDSEALPAMEQTPANIGAAE